ncbi:MAG: FG-GAP repeat domain-containing protein, partial [Planctomycetota bacterium]
MCSRRVVIVAAVAAVSFAARPAADTGLPAPSASHRAAPVAGAGSSCTHPLFAIVPRYGVGDTPRCVAVGDLDGDGHADLAVVNNHGDDVSILLNNGDGTFAAEVRYAVGYWPGSVAVG